MLAMKVKNHLKMHRLIQLAADSWLTPSQKQVLETHLAGCAECRAYADELKALETQLASVSVTRLVLPKSRAIGQQVAAIQTSYRRHTMKRNILSTAGALVTIVLVAVLIVLAGQIVPRGSSPAVAPTDTTGLTPFLTPIPLGLTRQNPGVAKTLGPGYCGTVVDGAVGIGSFIWPSNSQLISGYDFSLATNHPAIDIAGALGDLVYASDNGVIVYAGWNDSGYGNVVVIDHGNGWQTLYAHLSSLNVACGQSVYQGNVIGWFGSSGNSYDSHLHFEIMNPNGKVNPHDYLPALTIVGASTNQQNQPLRYFTRAESDVLPLQPWQLTPNPETPTPDPGFISNLTVTETEQLAGFDVLEPVSMAGLLKLQGASFDPQLNIVRIFYTNGFVLREERTKTNDDCDLCGVVGASAVVETVQIGDVTGEYVVGVWNLTDNGPVWESDPFMKILRWQANGIAFELMHNPAYDPEAVTLADMIAIAESIK
jgi:hypothetical protein